MFIEFQFANFMSFRDMQRFSMQAAPLRKNDKKINEENVVTIAGIRLLKSKGIYGANASGKSNLLQAIGAFSAMVQNSVGKEGLSKLVWNDRFKLISDWDDQPVFFQYIFLLNEKIYRYGFQVLKGSVSHEWLFLKSANKERELFLRTPEKFSLQKSSFAGAERFVSMVKDNDNELYREDSLFLTSAALGGNKFLNLIRNEIRLILTVDGVDDRAAVRVGMGMMETNEVDRDAIISFLRAADTSVESLEIEDISGSGSKKDNKENSAEELVTDSKGRKRLLSTHTVYDENGNKFGTLSTPFHSWESEGTNKLFGISALMLNSLKHGRTLGIDEFDARLHPNLSLKIVDIFRRADTNPNNAQLIFITHDSGLLKRANLRRDQICFVDKNSYGISSVRTLVEYKGVRKDESYDKEYLDGSYHGVPSLDNVENVIKKYLKQKSDALSKAK